MTAARELVTPHPRLERQDRPVAAPVGGPGRRVPSHLVGHPDRARERGPRIAIAGIEQVEVLGREVREALGVEGRGVALSEHLPPLDRVRREVRVDGFFGREEEVGRLGRHLVEIHVDLRRQRRVIPLLEATVHAAVVEHPCVKRGEDEQHGLHPEEHVVIGAKRDREKEKQPAGDH